MGAKALLWDLGGVVLSNGWDHRERAAAAARFGLDPAGFEARHAELADAFETGSLSLDDYLRRAVFHQPRGFAPEAFREFFFAQSQPLADTPATLALLAECRARGARTATLNNESAELNQRRIERFGLAEYFSAFCSSCYLGARKPHPEIFRRALGILHRQPEECVFIDDREENLAAPRGLGIDCIRFESAAALRGELAKRGALGG